VNVENGILNVITRQLRPHTPDFLSPVQLPVKYAPQGDGAAWKRFVEQTFPPDAQDLAWGIPAWAMTPHASIQKFVVLAGEGSNGKSTYLAGLTAFLGKPNICAVSLHRLENDRFAASRLVGKLANICPDLPDQKLSTSAMFKAITGGDLIQAERKYRDAFEFTPFSKLIFSANQLPTSDDASHAFFRRWVIVPLERTFEPGGDGTLSRDVLDSMLAAPEALSGLLNLALDALPRLRSKGFTTSASTIAALAEFKRVADPFLAWLDQNVMEDPQGQHCETRPDRPVQQCLHKCETPVVDRHRDRQGTSQGSSIHYGQPNHDERREARGLPRNRVELGPRIRCPVTTQRRRFRWFSRFVLLFSS
jgi:putative DNA primase/helicase